LRFASIEPEAGDVTPDPHMASRVVPTVKAIEESVDLVSEIFNRLFRKVPEKMKGVRPDVRLIPKPGG
jgi:hypothetical protein